MEYVKEEGFEEEEFCCCFSLRSRRSVGDDGSRRSLLRKEKELAIAACAKGGGYVLRQLQQKGKGWENWRRGRKPVFRYDAEDYALNFEREEDVLDDRMILKNLSI